MKAHALKPADLAERHSPQTRGIFLERAEYVSQDYTRRLVVDFDWPRASKGEPAWSARRYVARPHATSPNGIAWRLVVRAVWHRSLSGLHQAERAWMNHRAG